MIKSFRFLENGTHALNYSKNVEDILSGFIKRTCIDTLSLEYLFQPIMSNEDKND